MEDNVFPSFEWYGLYQRAAGVKTPKKLEICQETCFTDLDQLSPISTIFNDFRLNSTTSSINIPYFPPLCRVQIDRNSSAASFDAIF